jgi:predicted nucleic acid-binding Zn ribbon protein
MFKKRVQTIDEILQRFLREEGLETPLLQKRLIDSWETVVGDTVAQYTTEKFIKNQTLFVKITNPALRQDLGMMRSQLVKRLNETVSSLIITDIRLY